MDSIKVEPVPENLEPVKQVTSEQFSINWRDVGRGAIVAVLTAILASVQQALSTGGFEAIKWVEVVLPSGVLALVSYLGLQFGSATKTIRIYKKV
jgi:hypothetical protein